MKKIHFLQMLFLLMVVSCGSQNSDKAYDSVPVQAPDSDTGVMVQTNDWKNVFDSLKENKDFLDTLGLPDEERYAWYFDGGKVITGDLDGDGAVDALLPFSVEGRGGGNNSDYHWAVVLKRDGRWVYKSQYDLGGSALDYITELLSIEKNGVIKAVMKPQREMKRAEVNAEFIYKNGAIMEIFTGLHPDVSDGRDYLTIYRLMREDMTEIPVVSTLKEVRKILGEGKITTAEMECGTYYDDADATRYLNYPDLRYEISEHNDVALISVNINISDLRIQTNRGTLTGKTTLKEFTDTFSQPGDLWITDNLQEGVFTEVRVPACSECDTHWGVGFNKEGFLTVMFYRIEC